MTNVIQSCASFLSLSISNDAANTTVKGGFSEVQIYADEIE